MTKVTSANVLTSRYIANEYWPLPVTPTTHLEIHGIYHNALARQVPRDRLTAERAQHEEWLLTRPSSRMSFGDAARERRPDPALPVDQVGAETSLQGPSDEELAGQLQEQERQQQMEEDERVAHGTWADDQPSHNATEHIDDTDMRDRADSLSLNDEKTRELWLKFEQNKQEEEARDEQGREFELVINDDNFDDNESLTTHIPQEDGTASDRGLGIDHIKKIWVIDGVDPDSPHTEFQGPKQAWELEDERIRQLERDAEFARQLQAKFNAEDGSLDAGEDELPPLIYDDDVEPENRDREFAQKLERKYAEELVWEVAGEKLSRTRSQTALQQACIDPQVTTGLRANASSPPPAYSEGCQPPEHPDSDARADDEKFRSDEDTTNT